jgi:NADH:ubiquinone oxidoreductase subunit E
MATALDQNKLGQLKTFMAPLIHGAHSESNLIAILHHAQGIFGNLNSQIIDEISVIMNIPTAHIWGVATFYHFFKLKPQGKNIISVCLGTACYVKGADKVMDTVKKELKIEMGETSEDGVFTLQETRCLGTCGLAPVMMINDKVYGELTQKKVIEILNLYRKKGE